MERIPLSNKAFEGKNNVYLFEEGERTVLVDTGVGLDDVRTQLSSELGARGVEFGDVTDVFLTHWHHDHAGLAGAIQATGGATVHVHEADAGLVRQDPEAWEEYQDLLYERFDRWRMPAEAREELLRTLDLDGRMLTGPTEVTTFIEGERFDLGTHQFEVVHLPGHTEGLCGFAFEGPNSSLELLSGDALLPKYTPNVGGADARVERALEKYIRSLHRIIECDFTRAWPGHRTPIDEPSARANYILTYHKDRARRVFNVVREEGPIDTWSVSARLFGSLSSIHIIHGPGEAYAHLEHLEKHNLIERSDEGFFAPDPHASLEAS